MAWIESHTSLDKHHKVIRLRLAMRWSKNETIGFLHRFWWTVLEVSPSGDITALSSPEVMAEMLDMPVEAVAKALKVMLDPDPKFSFLDRKGGSLLVHDWLDYAGRYLSESKFKRNPEKMEEIRRVHGQSLDSPRIVPDTIPTEPTNQPKEKTPPGAPSGPSVFRLPVRSEEAVALGTQATMEAKEAEAAAQPKKAFPETSTPYRAARFFWSGYVKEWSPQAKEPTEAGYQAWALDLDRMFRLDKRSPQAFNELLDWIDTQPASKSGFTWRKNILSPATLRLRWNEGKFADFLPSELAREEFR